jgi:hypothetical protein
MAINLKVTQGSRMSVESFEKKLEDQRNDHDDKMRDMQETSPRGSRERETL